MVIVRVIKSDSLIDRLPHDRGLQAGKSAAPVPPGNQRFDGYSFSETTVSESVKSGDPVNYRNRSGLDQHGSAGRLVVGIPDEQFRIGQTPKVAP